MLRRRRRVALVLSSVVLALALYFGTRGILFLLRDEPQNFANVVEQYKYGSVGTEQDQGLPYYVWYVLPEVFSDLLPEGVGAGYERFGFIYERDGGGGRPRPIGATYREKPVPLTGLNCAACHTSTIRSSPSAPREIVLGMPAQRLRLWQYVNFLRAVGKDDRFDADTLMPAITRRFRLSRAERLFYRHVVIPRTKDGLDEIDRDFRWMDSWPAEGPGRVSTFTAWKIRFGYDERADDLVGTVDFPSVWNQGIRQDMQLHWDGNNASLQERNISAALVSGATADSLDLDQLDRVATWLRDLRPPPYPRPVDPVLAETGKRLYADACASCHDVDGDRVGRVTPLADLGTDPDRVRSFTASLADRMNDLGSGEPWAFSHFRTTSGYANAPLDGIWLRAPYLHNGSVPTLRALLFPRERPTVFYTGYDVYDWDAVGFVSRGPKARTEGFRFDTRLRGNSNAGHLYGTDLSTQQRLAIIEYLKTK
jgi:Cytochrome C oxidase, cbb3-type, subunit III